MTLASPLTSADVSTGGRIERRTVRGAIQAVLVSGLGAPAGFGIVVVLGRVSPTVLGFYALITLLVGLLSGLLSFGGVAVATRAAADSGSQFNRATAIQAFIAPPVAALVAVGVVLVTGFGANVSYLALAALAVAATLWMAAQGATTARLRFGVTSLLQNLPTLLQFPLFALLALAAPGSLRQDSHAIVIWSYLAIIGLVGVGYLGFLLERRRRGYVFTNGPAHLPRLVVGIQIIVILTFFFESGERFAALTAPDALTTLGKYFAGVQIAYLVRRIPTIVGQAALPGFAALRGSDRSVRIRRRTALRVGHLSFLVGSALVVASPLVGTIMGDRYQGTAGVIAIVAVACAATSAWPLDTSYATAEDRLRLYQVSLLVGSAAFLPLLFSQTLLILTLCRAGALVLAYSVVLTGLRGWTRERLTQLVVIAALGSTEIAIVHVQRTPVILFVTWLGGMMLYSALIAGQRRWHSPAPASAA